ncbi:hypothetical protein F2Q70_00041229 [Brassica cretica]|uniref:Uncharacterized protein n=1 Tax=Brassica cretica TaxID=69181 RepID=A0A8S9KBG9_BRACR|nr:hypothetical protein F2Q70_00041229 [Brassica cretica]
MVSKPLGVRMPPGGRGIICCACFTNWWDSSSYQHSKLVKIKPPAFTHFLCYMLCSSHGRDSSDKVSANDRI